MKEALRKRKILYHQHLTSRCDARTAARDVLALQAQFLRHAQMSLRLRSEDASWEQWVKQNVKTRAFRGTLHLLDAKDRLLITSALWKDYEHRSYYMARYYTPQEEQLFCNAIIELLQQGICGRREIYTRLIAMGLDEKLCELACSSWDGLFAVLNIQGKVIFQHAASREFTYAPISLRTDLDACRKELVYRYVKGYGPVTLRDACYFFGWKKKELEGILQDLCDVEISECKGHTVYELHEEMDTYPRIPTVVFLSGFDPLMLGYEKKENPFLPQCHLRKVFNLQGIVYSCFLYKGTVAGRWKLEKQTLQLFPFEDFDAVQRRQLEQAAQRQFQPARVEWLPSEKEACIERKTVL